MAINFPTSLDVFTDPSASDQLNLPSHSGQHTDLNNAVEALEAKVGINSSAVTSSHDYKIAQLEAGATGGKILQVVSTTKTDTFTTSASSFTDITGMSVSITPSSTSSKVLVIVSLQCNGDAATEIGAVQLVRDSTAICVGDTASSRTRLSASPYNASSGAIVPVGINYLDAPNTTSATTYKLQCFTHGAATFFVNRSDADADNATYGRAASTITVMEVAA